MKKLGVGIVGTGFIADWHYKGFKANPNAEITGICRDFYGDSLQRHQQKEELLLKGLKFGVCVFDSFESLVKDSYTDTLVIGSINPLHFEQIKLAIANHKHILIEKPVVTDFEQLAEIKKLSENSGIKIFPAHNFVYRKAVRKAKEIIEQGKLGQIIHSSFVVNHTISANHANGWRARKELGAGGTLIDSGHHLIYQLLYLLGKPSKIQCFKSKMVLKNMDCEDTAQVSLLYPDGSVATIMQSWTSDHTQMVNGIRIVGTQGNLVISDALYFNGEKIETDVEYADSFVNLSKAFTDCILNDIPPVSTLNDVHDTLKIVFGAYESAENECIVNF